MHLNFKYSFHRLVNFTGDFNAHIENMQSGSITHNVVLAKDCYKNRKH